MLSFVVPGLGQAIRRRWVEAALFLVAAVYLRLLLTGLAGEADRVAGLVLGAFGVAGGLASPTFLVFTVLAFVLHGLAAWDALRDHAPPAGGSSRPAEEVKAGEAI
ncbi:MAG: hypothetical protein IT385_24545 [Deltaproteobacteria bacterium]|nr:hypothetical protein [Deltaproteobacteria bacterium]